MTQPTMAYSKDRIVFDKPTLDRLYRYALSLCRDPDQACDLLQSGIEKYLRTQHPSRVDAKAPDNPIAYLFRIIRNDFIDQLRRQQPALLIDDAQSNPRDVPAETSCQSLERIAIDRQRVEGILAVLKPHERELLYLWAIEGYTVQEIADLQEVPRGTLLSRIHRLRERILRMQANEDTSPIASSDSRRSARQETTP